jgi:hypothetical protein
MTHPFSQWSAARPPGLSRAHLANRDAEAVLAQLVGPIADAESVPVAAQITSTRNGRTGPAVRRGPSCQ